MKKSSNRYMLLAMLLTFQVAVAFAQKRTDSVSNARQLTHISTDFNVSTEQALVIQKVLNYNHDAILATIRDKKLSPELRSQRLIDLQKERYKKIEAVLSASQLTAFKKAEESFSKINNVKQQIVLLKNEEKLKHPIKGAHVKDESHLNYNTIKPIKHEH